MSRSLAVRPTRAARHSARAIAALVAVALAAPAAPAQTTTLTFDALTAVDGSGVRFVDNCYEESGLRVMLTGSACGEAAALATWTPDQDLYYTGTPALYNNLGPSVDFTSLGGQPFSLRSMDLAPFLGELGVPTTVMFTGFLAAGGSVMRTVEVPAEVPRGTFGGPAMLTPFTFTGFDNLQSLRLTVSAPEFEPYVQFDNVTFGPNQVVPEPATLALFASGLLGVGAWARRRRAS